MPPFFLVVDPVHAVVGPVEEEGLGAPRAIPVVTGMAFYQTDEPLVADELVRLFETSGPACLATAADLSGVSPRPSYEVRDGASRTVSERVLYLDAIQRLKEDISHDQWAIQQGVAEGLERIRVFLMRCHEQARQWEPLVRDELADDIYPPQPGARMAPPNRTNIVGPRFLTVRFPVAFMGNDCLEALEDPPPVHEQQAHVFYETESQVVAEKLLEVLRDGQGDLAAYNPADTLRDVLKKAERGEPVCPFPPPIFDIVYGTELDFPKRIRYRQELELLERMADCDGDPGVRQDAGLPNDRRTVLLWRHYEQAKQLEPLIREELPKHIEIQRKDGDVHTGDDGKPGLQLAARLTEWLSSGMKHEARKTKEGKPWHANSFSIEMVLYPARSLVMELEFRGLGVLASRLEQLAQSVRESVKQFDEALSGDQVDEQLYEQETHIARDCVEGAINELVEWLRTLAVQSASKPSGQAEQEGESAKVRGIYVWWTWGSAYPSEPTADLDERFYFYKVAVEGVAARLCNAFRREHGDALRFGYTAGDTLDIRATALANDSVAKYRKGDVTGEDAHFFATAREWEMRPPADSRWEGRERKAADDAGKTSDARLRELASRAAKDVLAFRPSKDKELDLQVTTGIRTLILSLRQLGHEDDASALASDFDTFNHAARYSLYGKAIYDGESGEAQHDRLSRDEPEPDFADAQSWLAARLTAIHECNTVLKQPSSPLVPRGAGSPSLTTLANNSDSLSSLQKLQAAAEDIYSRLRKAGGADPNVGFRPYDLAAVRACSSAYDRPTVEALVERAAAAGANNLYIPAIVNSLSRALRTVLTKIDESGQWWKPPDRLKALLDNVRRSDPEKADNIFRMRLSKFGPELVSLHEAMERLFPVILSLRTGAGGVVVNNVVTVDQAAIAAAMEETRRRGNDEQARQGSESTGHKTGIGNDSIEEEAKGRQPVLKGRFVFGAGQVLFDGHDIGLRPGLPVEVLKKLVESMGVAVKYQELDQNSDDGEASVQLRTAKSEIASALKNHGVPCEIETKRAAGYLLKECVVSHKQATKKLRRPR